MTVSSERKHKIAKRNKMLAAGPHPWVSKCAKKKRKRAAAHRKNVRRKKQSRLIAEAMGGVSANQCREQRGEVCTTYTERAANLRSIGFSSYREYLKSSLWRRVRKQVFAAQGTTCQGCHVDDCNTVHHIDYDIPTLLGKRLDKLMVICGRCHKAIEFDDRGCKVSLAKAQERLAEFSRNILAGCAAEPF